MTFLPNGKEPQALSWPGLTWTLLASPLWQLPHAAWLGLPDPALEVV
jgi:hypothetical protein